jgi:hypothetical protein
VGCATDVFENEASDPFVDVAMLTEPEGEGVTNPAVAVGVPG